jgi:hypothetical protein
MIRDFQNWLSEERIDRKAFTDSFINKLRNASFFMGEFEDWWSTEVEMENAPPSVQEKWETKQRDLPEKVRYRGDLYYFEFKIMTSPSSHIWRFSTMNLQTFTLNLNSDMKGDLGKKFETLFEETLREFGMHGAVSSKKYGL